MISTSTQIVSKEHQSFTYGPTIRCVKGPSPGESINPDEYGRVKSIISLGLAASIVEDVKVP